MRACNAASNPSGLESLRGRWAAEEPWRDPAAARAVRVAALRAAIAEGRYAVGNERLARALLAAR